jgi:uncharacterized protein
MISVRAITSDGTGPVRGFLHEPNEASGAGLVLSHGAGSDCNAPLLVKVAECFAAAGVAVLRIDLPFRQSGKTPNPAQAVRDREGIKAAIEVLRRSIPGPFYLGGHSYGGRQSTLLAAEQPDPGVAALMLMSYPLHPPNKPEQLRTAHLPSLNVPSLFVHGTKDPFGSIAEMESALALIPANAAACLRWSRP